MERDERGGVNWEVKKGRVDWPVGVRMKKKYKKWKLKTSEIQAFTRFSASG